MAMPGEIMNTREEGDMIRCACGKDMPLEILQSAAGFYWGHACNECGPWSRESGYYPGKVQAQVAMDIGTVSWRDVNWHSGAVMVDITDVVPF